jgi:hypothetical protein
MVPKNATRDWELSPRSDLQDALVKCQTLTPSLLTGEQAIERLKEINVFVYGILGIKQ